MNNFNLIILIFIYVNLISYSDYSLFILLCRMMCLSLAKPHDQSEHQQHLALDAAFLMWLQLLSSSIYLTPLLDSIFQY